MREKLLYARGVTLAFALLCSTPAFAQILQTPEHRDWEFSGFVGRSFGDEFQFDTPVSGDAQQPSRTVGMRYGPGYLLGLRIRENINNLWSADLEYSFANQPLRFTNLSPDIQTLALSHYLHHLSYNVSFMPLPRTKRLRPYASAGIGAALFYVPGHAKNKALDQGLALRDSWEFLFNWGGGLSYLAIGQMALGFDVKHRLSRVPSYGIPPSARVVDGQYQAGLARHGIVQNWQINFSVAYQWDDD
jgi:opacity protein-like surface antigen